jgi:hypothetical protein
MTSESAYGAQQSDVQLTFCIMPTLSAALYVFAASYISCALHRRLVPVLRCLLQHIYHIFEGSSEAFCSL